MKPTLASLFPNASRSTAAANPQLMATNGGSGKQNDVQTILKPRRGKRGVMNNTEIAYALILKGMVNRGEILRYEFEGITLRWADMRYTPDFVVFYRPFYIAERIETLREMKEDDTIIATRLIEIKGGHIWDRDIVRFKGARAYWPEFSFEMWQLKKGQGWARKY